MSFVWTNRLSDVIVAIIAQRRQSLILILVLVLILILILCPDPVSCGCQGNAYFKEGKYEAAVECYSEGMEADGANILLHANRAMAYLRLHR